MKEMLSNISDVKDFVSKLPDSLILTDSELEEQYDGSTKCVFTYISDPQLAALKRRVNDSLLYRTDLYLLMAIGIFLLLCGMSYLLIVRDQRMTTSGEAAWITLAVGTVMVLSTAILLWGNRKRHRMCMYNYEEYKRIVKSKEQLNNM